MFKQELLQSSDNFKKIYDDYRKANDKFIKAQDKMLDNVEKVIDDKYPNIREFHDKFFIGNCKHDNLKSALNYATELLVSLSRCQDDFNILFAYDKEWTLSDYLFKIFEMICKNRFSYSIPNSDDNTSSFSIIFWNQTIIENMENLSVLIDWLNINYCIVIDICNDKNIFNFDVKTDHLSDDNEKIIFNLCHSNYLNSHLL